MNFSPAHSMNLSPTPVSILEGEDNPTSRKRPRNSDTDCASSPPINIPPQVLITALKGKLMEKAQEVDSLRAALSMEKREHELKTRKLKEVMLKNKELTRQAQVVDTETDTGSNWLEISSLRNNIAELQAQNQMLKQVRIEQFNEKMEKLEKENESLRALMAEQLVNEFTASSPTAPPPAPTRKTSSTSTTSTTSNPTSIPSLVQQPLPMQPVQPRVAPHVPTRKTSSTSTPSSSSLHSEPRVVTVGGATHTSSVLVGNATTTSTAHRYSGSMSPNVYIQSTTRTQGGCSHGLNTLHNSEPVPFGYAKGAIHVV